VNVYEDALVVTGDHDTDTRALLYLNVMDAGAAGSVSVIVRPIVVLGIPLKNAVVDTVYPNPPVDVVTRHEEYAFVDTILLITDPPLVGLADTSKDENASFAL
jgi:predicted RNA methylase